jgi:hypothetical protein
MPSGAIKAPISGVHAAFAPAFYPLSGRDSATDAETIAVRGQMPHHLQQYGAIAATMSIYDDPAAAIPDRIASQSGSRRNRFRP